MPFPPPSRPAQPQANPFAPSQFQPLVFTKFNGVNTQASRTDIDDAQAYWLDGFMPIGTSNARTIPGVGLKMYEDLTTAVVDFDFANIGTTPIMMVFKADGAIYQVNTNTQMITLVAAAGTITNPSAETVAMTQWGSQYVLIVAQQTNGYWVWDGITLFSAGGVGPLVVITAGGTGYTGGATVGFSGGSGSGATATATVVNGVVISIKVTSPGTGYVVGDTVTVAITPVSGGSGATATVTIMPFGVSGNAIETFTSRVWIANNATVTVSAPASFTDFSTSSGGGSFTSNDSFLRVRFVALKQSNGFLYLIADSSVNYISGVQTSGSPATTTFTNQNADPEVGTPYSTTVDVIGSNIVFANAWGIHVSYGGRTSKISEMMDGVYNSVPGFDGFQPSATKAILYGTRIWCLLLPLVDLRTGIQSNKLMCWNGEVGAKACWWTTAQDVNLVYVQHQEIDSVLTPYGSTGNAIYQLFQTPSINFTKGAMSKLWVNPGIQFNKGHTRLWGMVNYYSIESPDIIISVDNENGQANTTIAAGPQAQIWINNSNGVLTMFNNNGDPMTVYASGTGISVFPPQTATQNGVLGGFSLQTNAADVALIQFAMDNSDMGYRG